MRTILILKNAVFWDVVTCGTLKNRRFGGTCRLHLQGRKNSAREESVSSWLTRSSETSVLTRPTPRHIPEDCILHSHRCENLKSYMLILSRHLLVCCPISRTSLGHQHSLRFIHQSPKPTNSPLRTPEVACLTISFISPCIFCAQNIPLSLFAIVHMILSDWQT
jgi:hypothetical protein